MTRVDHETCIRRWMTFFIGAVALSGMTAFPLETETRWLLAVLRDPGVPPALRPAALVDWIARVHQGLVETNAQYPFLAYGTDWLAFAHLAIALAFVGVWRDPVRNAWLVDWGLLTCAAVIPLALVCGHVRGIPFGWRLIDISFGVFGAIPLLIVRREIRHLAAVG